MESILRDPEIENMFGDIIDFDKEPKIPLGSFVISEDQPRLDICLQGRWKFDKSHIARLHLADIHKREIFIEKIAVCDWPFKFLGAQILDYYYANQHLIPNDWDKLTLLSMGTIYRDGAGDRYIRCLFKNGARWYFGQQSLMKDFADNVRTLVFCAP